MAQHITLYRKDFRVVPEDDADFFADLLFDLGYGRRGDYESVASFDEVTIEVTGAAVASA